MTDRMHQGTGAPRAAGYSRRGVLRAAGRLALLPALAAAGGALGACSIGVLGASGTPDRPIKMALASSAASEKILPTGQTVGMTVGRLAALVTQASGYQVQAEVLPDYAPMVQALSASGGDELVDVGWLGPFSAVVARARSGAGVILATIRNGSKTYRSQIVVPADSGVKSLAELRGKRFAFVDPESTSGFLYPAAEIVQRFNVRPEQFFGQVFIAGSHPKVVQAVYNRQVDGGACYGQSGGGPENDARIEVRDIAPDVMRRVVRVAEIAEPIPNDPVSVRRGLAGAVTARLKTALITAAGSDEGQRLLSALNGVAIDGLLEASDADYDPLRKKAELLRIDLNQAIGPAPSPSRAKAP